MKIYTVAVLALAMGTLCWAQSAEKAGCNGCQAGKCTVLKDGHIVRCLACEEGFTRIRLADKLSMACIPDTGSRVTSDVFDAVLAGNISGLAIQLESSDDVQALARGFTFPPERRDELLEKTYDRRGDPDVVSIKAFAQAALSKRRDCYKLSQVMTLALYPKGNETVRSQLDRFFSDMELMERTLNADPTKEFVPAQGGRQLLCDGCTPVNAFPCAHCWTNVVCAVNFWCPNV